MVMNDLFLVFVRLASVNTDGVREYDLYFSDSPDIVWGLDWEVLNPSSCTDLIPDPSTYSKVVRIKSTKYPFTTAEEVTCYSMEYVIARIMALAWVDISNLEEYPDEGRCVLHFGDTIAEVKEKLNKQLIDFDV